MPATLKSPPVQSKAFGLQEPEQGPWLVLTYASASLFTLKASWATSTAGKTLVTPTPYSVKMAFLDAALRSKLVREPDAFIDGLKRAGLQIGVPRHACVSETIQRVRQETRDVDRELDPELPPYRPNVAMRQMVHYQGELRFAFDRKTCGREFAELLIRVAPVINYIGRRGCFIQYRNSEERSALDGTFTTTALGFETWGHRASLDDFGPKASFDVLNSYSTKQVKRGVHRIFVDTLVPLGVRNVGPGFTHYSRAPSALL